MTKKLYTHKGKTFTLDEEEQEIMNAYEKGELTLVKNQAKEISKAIQAAKNTEKRKTISMRVNYRDLLKFKTNAAEEGMPYQTLLGSLIHKYNTGQLVFRDKSEERYQASKKSKNED